MSYKMRQIPRDGYRRYSTGSVLMWLNNNKRPRGHIAHLRTEKTVQINKYKMIIPKHYLLFENWMVLHLQKKTWIPFTQENFVPSLVEIGTVILEKNFRFRYYLSLEKGMTLYLNKLESS